MTRNLQVLPQNQSTNDQKIGQVQGTSNIQPAQALNQNLEDLKQFQAFVMEKQSQTLIQSTQETEGEVKTQEQLRQLYEFTTQIQSNQQNAQLKANTFIPKTLGLKQPSGTTTVTNPQPEKTKPQQQQYRKEVQYETKYEKKTYVEKDTGRQQSRNQPHTQNQGSFDFNSFVSSNLGNVVQTNPSSSSSKIPQGKKSGLNEHSIKEALNIPTTSGRGKGYPGKHKLNVGSETYTTYKVIQRSDQPPKQSTNVSDLEKNVSTPNEQKPEQTQNILQNLFTNPSALGLNVTIEKKEATSIEINQTGTQEALQSFMSNLGLGQSNPQNNPPAEDQNNFQNLIANLGPTVNLPQSNPTENQAALQSFMTNLGLGQSNPQSNPPAEDQSNFQNLIANLGPNIALPQASQTESQPKSQDVFQNLISSLGPNVNISQDKPTESEPKSQNVFDNLLSNLGTGMNLPQGNVVQDQPVVNVDEIEKNYQGSPIKEANEIVHDSVEGNENNNKD